MYISRDESEKVYLSKEALRPFSLSPLDFFFKKFKTIKLISLLYLTYILQFLFWDIPNLLTSLVKWSTIGARVILFKVGIREHSFTRLIREINTYIDRNNNYVYTYFILYIFFKLALWSNASHKRKSYAVFIDFTGFSFREDGHESSIQLSQVHERSKIFYIF